MQYYGSQELSLGSQHSQEGKTAVGTDGFILIRRDESKNLSFITVKMAKHDSGFASSSPSPRFS